MVSDLDRPDCPGIDSIKLDATFDGGERTLDDERVVSVDISQCADFVEDMIDLQELNERGAVERDTIGASLAWSVADGLPNDQADTATGGPEQ